jgi:hypothetical protein
MAVTRLGLSATPRSLYGSFAGKTEATIPPGGNTSAIRKRQAIKRMIHNKGRVRVRTRHS